MRRGGSEFVFGLSVSNSSVPLPVRHQRSQRVTCWVPCSIILGLLWLKCSLIFLLPAAADPLRPPFTSRSTQTAQSCEHATRICFIRKRLLSFFWCTRLWVIKWWTCCFQQSLGAMIPTRLPHQPPGLKQKPEMDIQSFSHVKVLAKRKEQRFQTGVIYSAPIKQFPGGRTSSARQVNTHSSPVWRTVVFKSLQWLFTFCIILSSFSPPRCTSAEMKNNRKKASRDEWSLLILWIYFPNVNFTIPCIRVMTTYIIRQSVIFHICIGHGHNILSNM